MNKIQTGKSDEMAEITMKHMLHFKINTAALLLYDALNHEIHCPRTRDKIIIDANLNCLLQFFNQSIPSRFVVEDSHKSPLHQNIFEIFRKATSCSNFISLLC